MVSHILGNVKQCERVDVQLEKHKKEKMKGLEYDSTSANVGCL